MKILFCDNSLRELLNFRKVVIEAYVAWGCEVVLVAPKNCDYEPESSRIKVVTVDMNRSGKNPFQDLKYCHTLRTIYKKERPDYIFTIRLSRIFTGRWQQPCAVYILLQ